MIDKDEVVAKASDYLDYAINNHARHLPEEIKEDIKQIGFLRVLRAYERIDEERNSWKAFIQNHCNGAVLDYLKSPKNLRYDIELSERDDLNGESLVDLGIYYNSASEKKLDIKWDLVSRMASKDDRVFLVARFILGYTISDVSRNSKMSRETVTKKMQEFCDLLDDPFEASNPWINQIIYAFGLCPYFNMKDEDNGEGWDLEPIDIFANEIEYKKKVYTNQLELI